MESDDADAFYGDDLPSVVRAAIRDFTPRANVNLNSVSYEKEGLTALSSWKILGSVAFKRPQRLKRTDTLTRGFLLKAGGTPAFARVRSESRA